MISPFNTNSARSAWTRGMTLARYVHLNPVRIGGLGLGKDDQRRARVMGCADPGAELVRRRVSMLREYRWSLWRVYAGWEGKPEWLTTDRLESGCGGRGRKAPRAALVAYTEAPIRVGRLESPWEGLVAGSVLGEAEEARALVRAAAGRPGGPAARIQESNLRERPEMREFACRLPQAVRDGR